MTLTETQKLINFYISSAVIQTQTKYALINNLIKKYVYK